MILKVGSYSLFIPILKETFSIIYENFCWQCAHFSRTLVKFVDSAQILLGFHSSLLTVRRFKFLNSAPIQAYTVKLIFDEFLLTVRNHVVYMQKQMLVDWAK